MLLSCKCHIFFIISLWFLLCLQWHLYNNNMQTYELENNYMFNTQYLSTTIQVNPCCSINNHSNNFNEEIMMYVVNNKIYALIMIIFHIKHHPTSDKRLANNYRERYIWIFVSFFVLLLCNLCFIKEEFHRQTTFESEKTYGTKT